MPLETPQAMPQPMPQNTSNSYALSREVQLQSVYVQQIQPFWQQIVKQGEFVGTDNIAICYAYAIPPNSIGSVVISSGRIEAYIKYKEQVFDLYQNGYSVFILDHRGQGLSGRMCPNPHMGYVKHFDDYLSDFKVFVETVVKPNSIEQPKLLCHSMGGAIGALYCLRYSDDFAKVAFLAPMFGIRPAMPGWFANMLVRSNIAIKKLRGEDVSYFIGQGDYENKPFAENDLSQSEVRYQLFRQEYEEQPQVKLGGVTGQWLLAAAAAINRIEKLAPTFPIPCLVIQAGADEVVDNNRQSRVSAQLANCKNMVIAGAKHEMLMEQDQYRLPCLQATLDFFKSTD